MKTGKKVSLLAFWLLATNSQATENYKRVTKTNKKSFSPDTYPSCFLSL